MAWLEKYLTKPGARYYREEALAEYRELVAEVERLRAIQYAVHDDCRSAWRLGNEQNEWLQAKNEWLQAKNEWLREQVDQIKREESDYDREQSEKAEDDRF